ncbi:MAG: site-specific DNA-methyltransferase [Polyangiaceae bacterium]
MSNTPHAVRLDWSGKNENAPLPSAELELEAAGSPDMRLLSGDNLAALSALGRGSTRAMLIYLDPPFFTGREHNHVQRSRGEDGIVRKLSPAFDDRWQSLEHYLSELAIRLRAARDLLDPRGCLVLHVDPKTSHYAKVLCDEIFGPAAFASEIVWRYRRWPAKTKNFQRVHDVLLRYVRDPDQEPRFQQLYEPLAASTAKTWGTNKQRAVVSASGRRTRSSVTEQESPGAPLGDVWDISIIAPVARERTGYPTQKPEALLERLIASCTEPGDLVLDAYCGSGTSLAVSARLGRRALGIDQNPQALAITKERLEALGVTPRSERVVLQAAEARPKVLKSPRGATRARRVA